MQAIWLFVASLAGSAILTALSVLVDAHSYVWSWTIRVGAAVFVASTILIALDYLRPGGSRTFLTAVGVSLAALMTFAAAWYGSVPIRHVEAQAPNEDRPLDKPALSPLEAAAISERERFAAEWLADPTLSPQTKIVIERQKELFPLKMEYRRLNAPRVVSAQEMKSPEAISYYNKRLNELRKGWQITPENIDSVFGNIITNSSIGGAVSTGVLIRGGGGNTFDQTDITGVQTGVDLEDTKNNQFSNTRISGFGASKKK